MNNNNLQLELIKRFENCNKKEKILNSPILLIRLTRTSQNDMQIFESLDVGGKRLLLKSVVCYQGKKNFCKDDCKR